MASDSPVSTSTQASKDRYTDLSPRISKENLCMVLAIWMETFPESPFSVPETDDKKSPHRKVGAVLVLPNDMIHAIDCSRGGVHGVARLLMRHSDVAKDCKVFVSRKPCSFCSKLLVQSRIKRIFYLPIEPEYKDVREEESSRVDNLFKTSPISQSVFVPTVGKDVIASAKKGDKQEIREAGTKKWLFHRFWNEEWMGTAKDDLPWPAFDDSMKNEVRANFENITEWMECLVIEERKGHILNAVPVGEDDPKENKNVLSVSRELLTLAKFLAERSDDPKTGVGAVITNKAFEIVALGWNGFPTKALYGEFPRASHHDDQVKEKKYPYMIHAEQNALLLRNTKNLKNGILFVTKTPCDECTPLLAMEGIKTVVLGEILAKKESAAGNLTYTKFDEKFTCFEMSSVTDDREAPENETGEPPKKKARRNITGEL